MQPQTAVVLDLDRFAKTNGRRDVKIDGRVYELRQFSVRQVAALASAPDDEPEAEAMNRMIDILANRLTDKETGQLIDRETLLEMEQDTLLFLLDALPTQRAMKGNGVSAERQQEILAEVASYSVPADQVTDLRAVAAEAASPPRDLSAETP